MKAILGKKIGMTRIYDEKSNPISVSLIQAGPCFVTQIKTDKEHGYNAIQIGYHESKKLNKSEAGHLKNVKALKYLKEFVVTNDEIAKYKVGEEIKLDTFKVEDNIDVSGVSKGKGFAGTVKRHHFHTGPKTHGSNNYRQPGSIGSTYPQRTIKGRRMAGHLGAKQCTVKKLTIVDMDLANNLIIVKGTVPGAKKSLLFIKGK